MVQVKSFFFFTDKTKQIYFFILAVSFDEDISVEIQAFRLQIDPRIVDRLDNYILAIMALNKKKQEEPPQFAFPPNPHLERR